jgi:hypothetical protein
MRNRIRPRLTYANVMSSIAVFMLLGGGAYATIDRQIRTADIQNRAVTKPKLAKGAVGTAKIDRRAVGTGKIKANAVGIGKMKDNSVGTDQLRDGSVEMDKIGNEAVGTEKIQNDAVGTEQVAAESITTGKLAPQAVEHGKLADGAVIPSKLGNIITRTNQVAIPDTEVRTLGVACLADELVLSGGAGFTTVGQTDRWLVRSRKAGNGWSTRAANHSGAARTLRVEAYCLQP